VHYVITDHARFEMRRRGIPEDMLQSVLNSPEQVIAVRTGRVVLQSRMAMEGQTYLLRVFADTDGDPVEVVTVYRTSKIEKYWRTEP